MPPSARAREVFAHYRLRLGLDRPPVAAYHSDDRQLRVDVLEAEGCPARGLRTVATLGLSDFPNNSPSGDVRVELLLAGPSDADYAGNVLATAAFDVVRGPYPGAWPGALKPGAISRNVPGAPMPDALIVAPFCWEDLQDLPEVHFLQVIPIHASESSYCLAQGSDALEDLFESDGTDVFNWARAPVI